MSQYCPSHGYYESQTVPGCPLCRAYPQGNHPTTPPIPEGEVSEDERLRLATNRVAAVMVRRYGARFSEETDQQAEVLARAALEQEGKRWPAQRLELNPALTDQGKGDGDG